MVIERTKTYSAFHEMSNRTLRKLTAEVNLHQELPVLHNMKSGIPNILNDALDFFFAYHMVLLSCMYEAIENSRSSPNPATQLFNADMSVNISGVDLCCPICYCGKNVTINLVAKNLFSLVKTFGNVPCERAHDLFSHYQ
jgi:hypothetical protein